MILLVAVMATLLLALQMVPEWQVRRAGVRSTAVNPEATTRPSDIANLENEMRKTFIQVVGGVFAIIALYFTYRRVKASEEGQITDRFSKAIEQLGALTAENKPNVEVRLGAIYALERIAMDSPRDHWTIMEVLTAYVRQNAPRSVARPTAEPLPILSVPRPPTEIQAILSVLGRRRLGGKREPKEQYIDLSNSDLRGAFLHSSHFERASFYKSDLEFASFHSAHLEEANFSSANGKNAIFFGAHLARARFDSAEFDETLFNGSHLEQTSFDRTRVHGASFVKTIGLTAKQIAEAQYAGARFDAALQKELEQTGKSHVG